MYWSCLPIGSLEQVDLDLARLLGQLARMDQVLAVDVCSALSRAVVKLPDEPSPVPAGMSAMLVISRRVGRRVRPAAAPRGSDRVLDLVDDVDLAPSAST